MLYGTSAAMVIAYVMWVLGRPQWTAQIRMPALFAEVSAELHPFVPGLAVGLFLADSWGQPLTGRVLDAALAALQLIGWLFSPNDDDRWKRRRRRLAARIRSAGRRLAAEYTAAG